MKILHIHSDKKFIKGCSSYYNSPYIENSVIFLGTSREHDETIMNMQFSKDNANIIASKANDYDIVIFYSLRLEHAIICNKIKSNVIVIWRFFGAELYPYLYKEMIYKNSLKYYRHTKLHHIFSVIKNNILYSASAEELFWNAVKRSNYFCGLSKTEYSYLKGKFSSLPPFIQHPYIKINKDINFELWNRDLIVLGHSRDIYGNHFEVINGLKEHSEIDKYQYVMFFSYSEYSKEYSKAVIDSVKSIPSIKVISEFLIKSDYLDIMKKTAAIVINSYRQMAMGNIFHALRNGIKVYMSEKNIMYDWLLEEGFLVFSIKEFFYDIKESNINLTDNQAQFNRNAFVKLADKYSIEDFHEKLISLSKC